MAQSAAIYGLSGLALTEDERAFFQDVKPWGFIVFKRNCETPAQLRALTDSLRDLTGNASTPILIDQEGGRVARLRPPHWRLPPPAAVFTALHERDIEMAIAAAMLNSRLIGAELVAAGVNVSCAPVADLRFPGAHDIIGDRSYSTEPHVATELGRAVAEGLMDAGVLPVLKHIPGHGRALSDSHLDLPIVETPHDELARTDFVPFRGLNDLPMAMTAHVVYAAIDAQHCATLSGTVISQVIRREIGFDGLLMSDDLGMKALSGSFDGIARRALAAGCDVVLHCSGELNEMQDVARGVKNLDGEALRRAQAALAQLRAPAALDVAEAVRHLDSLVASVSAA